MEFFTFFILLSLIAVGTVISTGGINSDPKPVQAVGLFLLIISSATLGWIIGDEIGKIRGLREASKQCQLEECPYTVKDSTQIYLEPTQE